MKRWLFFLLVMVGLVSCSRSVGPSLPELNMSVMDFDGHVRNFQFVPKELVFREELQSVADEPMELIDTTVDEEHVPPEGLSFFEAMEEDPQGATVVNIGQSGDYKLSRIMTPDRERELIMVYYQSDLQWFWLFERTGAKVYSATGKLLLSDLYLQVKRILIPNQ